MCDCLLNKTTNLAISNNSAHKLTTINFQGGGLRQEAYRTPVMEAGAGTINSRVGGLVFLRGGNMTPLVVAAAAGTRLI